MPEPESTNNEILISFGMVVATLILAFVPGTAGFLGIMTTILGLISAIKAKERGNVTGGTAIIVNMVVLVIWIAARVIFQLKAS